MKTVIKTMGVIVIGCGLLVVGMFFGEEIGDYKRRKVV